MPRIEIKGEGSVQPLDGRSRYRCRKWQLRVTLSKDGARRTATRTFPSPAQERAGIEGTYTQARKALSDFIAELQSPAEAQGAPSPTFAEYAKHWCDIRAASGDYSERTVTAQRFALSNVSLHIGGVALDALSATLIEGVYAKLRAGESRSEKPLSGATLAQTHRAVIGMVHYAESHGDMPEGLLRGLRMPKSDTREKRALPDSDAAALMGRFIQKPSPYSVCAALCLSCGLRRSEALAVLWRDIEGDVMHVSRSLDERGRAKAPKSRAGVRSVPVPGALSRLLDVWREKQRLGGEGAVCSWDGGYMKPATMTVWWQRNADGLGAAGLTLHELRHTYLTMLARQGVHPRVMQELAGHETIDVTLRIYSHASMEEKARAVAAVGALAE